jgi:pimeloyl-ACP methyl ester carboxylesterase
VDGYFAELRALLEPHTTLIEVDPPELDEAAGRRWLRLRDHAAVLTAAMQQANADRVVVVGHSLGGLVALRLALDQPDRIGGLLLLDPSPLMPAWLLPSPLLQVVGSLRQTARRLTTFATPARRQTSIRPARAVPLATRLLWYLALDGMALAADTCLTKLRGVPTVVVSAGEHTPGSVTRRTHEQLANCLSDGRLEIWPDTTHPLHVQRPAEVAEAVDSLIARRKPSPSAP